MAVSEQDGFVYIDGKKDIGYLDLNGYRESAPIRLEVGDESFGLEHAKLHETEILNAGFESVEQFIYHVANNFTEVRKGNNARLILDIPNQRTGDMMTVMLKASDDGSFWSVSNAAIVRAKYLNKFEKLPVVNSDGSRNASGERQDLSLSSENKTAIRADNALPTGNQNTTTTNLTKQQVNEDDRTNIGINSDNADIRQLAAAVGKYTGRGDADIREAGQLDDSVALEAVSRAFGKRVVVFESFGRDTWFQGAVLENNAEAIYISANSTEPAMAVLGHEMMHKIRAESPALYKQAIDAVRPLFNEQAEARMTEINEQSERDSGLIMSRNELEEEMLADVFGDNFMDQSFWAAVARNMDAQNKGAFGKFIAKVREFLRDAFARLSPYGTDKMLTDVQAAQDALAQVAAMHLSAKAGNKANAAKLAEIAAQFSVTTDKPSQPEIAQAQRDLDTQLAIADKLEAEYGYLPAPNGEKSNLNRLQWAQVRTPQFKEFYGDWEKNGKQLGVYRGSEESSDWRGVVGSSQTIATTDRGAIGGNSARGSGVAGFTDGNGEPVIFYHGTSDDFDSFDTNHANRKDKGWLGH